MRKTRSTKESLCSIRRSASRGGSRTQRFEPKELETSATAQERREEDFCIGLVRRYQRKDDSDWRATHHRLSLRRARRTWNTDEANRELLKAGVIDDTAAHIFPMATYTVPNRGRDVRWGYRGKRVGEASHPGPRHNMPDIRRSLESSVQSKLHEWRGDDFINCRLQAHTTETSLHVDETSLSIAARDCIQHIGSELVGAVTNGNGACGLHAIFGEPSTRGELYKEGARRLAATLLCSNPQALQQAGVEQRYITSIGQSFWNEFVKPTLKEEPSARGGESLLFWRTLQKMLPDLAQECQACYIEYGKRAETLADTRRAVTTASQRFFTLEMEECFVRPLATGRGFLPQSIEMPRLGDSRYIAHLLQPNPDNSEWLGPAFDEAGYIRASQPREMFPSEGPLCKYMALFQASSAYDGLRQAFIEGADASCHESKELLGGIIQRVLEDALVPDEFATQALDFSDKLNAYQHVYQQFQHVSEVPPDFATRAWPIYLDCVKQPGYYCSIDELMAMCNCAHVNVILFQKKDARTLVLEDCSLRYEGTPIMVKLDGNSRTRVRGHYERLISLQELKHFEEDLSAEVREIEEAAEKLRTAARDSAAKAAQLAAASSTADPEKSVQPTRPPTPLGTLPERKRRRLNQKTNSLDEPRPAGIAPSEDALDTMENSRTCEGEENKHDILQQHFNLRTMQESEHPCATLQRALFIVKAHIREHPTVLSDPNGKHKPMQDVFNDKLAPKLPNKHCAFMGCSWEGSSENTRIDHLKDPHGEMLESAAKFLPKCFTKDVRYASIDNEAIAEKIREGAPLASYAIDRRALQNFNDALHENSICAPMCFLCGCIYIYRERPTEDLRPGQARDENYIQWQKPFEKDDMFFSLTRLQTEEQYGQQTYLR